MQRAHRGTPTFLERSTVWLTIVRYGVRRYTYTQIHRHIHIHTYTYTTHTHTRTYEAYTFARSFSPFCLSPPLFLTGILPCPSRFSVIFFTLQLLSSRASPSLLRAVSISSLERYLLSLSLSFTDPSRFLLGSLRSSAAAFAYLFISAADFHRYVFSLYQFRRHSLFPFRFSSLLGAAFSSSSEYTGISFLLSPRPCLRTFLGSSTSRAALCVPPAV